MDVQESQSTCGEQGLVIALEDAGLMRAGTWEAPLSVGAWERPRETADMTGFVNQSVEKSIKRHCDENVIVSDLVQLDEVWPVADH